MLAYIEGTQIDLGPDFVVCLTNGLGYRIFVTRACLKGLEQKPDQQVKLWLEEIVRDGQVILFGFQDFAEKQWFQWLIQVQGVSGKMALNILSQFAPNQIQGFILREEAHRLKAAEGVGPKLAVRLIHELKDKAQKWVAVPSQKQQEQDDIVFQALLALGYKSFEALKSIQNVAEKNTQPMEVSEWIQACLKELN